EQKNEVFQKCDFIVCLLPLTAETYNFIDYKEIQLMKKNSYILNVSRGEVVNENALIDALENEEISGAVLDVFREEPLPEDSKLFKTKNALITPHITGYRHPQRKPRAFKILFDNLKYFEKGNKKLINEIDKEKGY